jgi:pilus assembly protein Flp/PilA
MVMYNLDKEKINRIFEERRNTAMLFSRNEKGQGMVEYALIIVLVAVVLIIVLALVGSQISNVFSRIISGLST